MKEKSFKAFGSDIYVSLPEAFFDVGFKPLVKEAQRIEVKFSRFIETSELSFLNKSLNQWHQVDEEWIYLLETFLMLSDLTGGSLTLGTTELLEHWGYDKDYNLKKEAAQKSFPDLVIEIEGEQFKANQALDFGSFGKGYFLDQARDILDAAAVPYYHINAGGDLTVKQKNPETFFLEDPRVNGRIIGETVLQDGFLCASSSSRRRWGAFHHLIDWQQQAPAKGLQAVYVKSEVSGLVTDALSTAFFVMGETKARNKYEAFKKQYSSIELMLINADGKIWRSENFAARLYTS